MKMGSYCRVGMASSLACLWRLLHEGSNSVFTTSPISLSTPDSLACTVQACCRPPCHSTHHQFPILSIIMNFTFAAFK